MYTSAETAAEQTLETYLPMTPSLDTVTCLEETPTELQLCAECLGFPDCKNKICTSLFTNKNMTADREKRKTQKST